ncbi:hypothetical protein ABZ508_02785 [Streptomyces lavendulocolor]|uniref:Uncharacterized protein n=1 Tax=Streptomyces lavendulocolor TaxID=67316 RepID=A0ABV2VYC5_9ACTN
MSINPTPQLSEQGAAVLLLARIHQSFGHLPAAEFHVSSVYLGRLEITVHDDLDAFELWRTALGLDAPEEKHHGGTSWLAVSGRVEDAPVTLCGFAAREAVTAAARAAVTA